MEIEVRWHNKKGYEDFFGTKEVDQRLLDKAKVQEPVKGSGYDGLRGIILNHDPDAAELFDDDKITWVADVKRIKKLKLLAILRPFKGMFARHDGLDMVIRR